MGNGGRERESQSERERREEKMMEWGGVEGGEGEVKGEK